MFIFYSCCLGKHNSHIYTHTHKMLLSKFRINIMYFMYTNIECDTYTIHTHTCLPCLHNSIFVKSRISLANLLLVKRSMCGCRLWMGGCTHENSLNVTFCYLIRYHIMKRRKPISTIHKIQNGVCVSECL